MSKLLMFQFTHPGRGATGRPHLPQGRGQVSIHAPREGCDHAWHIGLAPHCEVSIHAPREGCDTGLLSETHLRQGFNSRTPGGVRPPAPAVGATMVNGFNSRTPGGVRPRLVQRTEQLPTVSIHAPREGCDLRQGCQREKGRGFQFTHPARGATLRLLLTPWRSHGFNSRTPRGVRQYLLSKIITPTLFQFTHPARGATHE